MGYYNSAIKFLLFRYWTMELKKYCGRFPSVLREALESGLVKFSNDIQWEYDDMEAYRGIRIGNGKVGIDKTDFKSYAEMKDNNQLWLFLFWRYGRVKGIFKIT